MTKSSPRLRLRDPGPSPRTTTESLSLLTERVRAIDAFVVEHGLDYWDHADSAAQLELGRAA
jgi:hypothetical protein